MMKTRSKKRGDIMRWRAWLGTSFFRKSLLLVLCISSIPTAAVGAASYVIGKTHIEQEVKRTQDVLLKNGTDRIDGLLSHLELNVTQWALDPRFRQRIDRWDLQTSYNEIQTLYKALTVMRNTYPFIEQIQVHLPGPAALITDMDGIVYLRDPAQRSAYDALYEGTRSLRWANDLPRPGRPDETSIALAQRLPGGEKDAYGSLVVHIHPEKLATFADELRAGDDALAFLLRDDGLPMFDESAVPSELTPLFETVRARVTAQDGRFGSFVLRGDGTDYSVSYGRLDRLGSVWTYVTAVPLDNLTAPVVTVSRLLLAISGCTLLFAALLSWFASARLSRPVRNLVNWIVAASSPAASGVGFAAAAGAMDSPAGTGASAPSSIASATGAAGDGESRNFADSADVADEFTLIRSRWDQVRSESRSVRETLERSMPLLREGFLLQMMQGHYYSLTEEQLRKRMESLRWDVAARKFSLIYVRVGDPAELEGRFRDDDTQLVTFAAANVMRDVAAGWDDPVEFVNFQDLSVAALVFAPAGRLPDAQRKRLRDLAAALLGALNEVLRLEATVLVGETTPRLGDVPRMLEEAKYAIRLKEARRRNAVVRLDELTDARRNGSGWYPFRTEKELLEAVRVGHPAEIRGLLDRFFSELEEKGANELDVREGSLQLLGSIRHAMLESGAGSQQLFDRTLFGEVQHVREPSRLSKWMMDNVIEPFLRERELQKEHVYREAVEAVCALVRERYMEELSLESCAERVGVSPFTLSRTFKRIKGVNFVDYLTSVRLAKAKELLVDTDLKVNEIAERVGYQPSYLIRVFKKTEGVTPGQYRERL